MYGLKEKILAKYIIKILKIDKASEDAVKLLNWKQPGWNRYQAEKSAGIFTSCVYDVVRKRPFRVEPGHMTIADVNELLNELSSRSKEEDQLPIIEQFYRQMNPEEFKWLVCIIIRSMSIGATEKTLLAIWHPDAEVLFNISSSLKKVCWELWNHSIRLQTDEDHGVILFECFQPQLANFQPKKLKSIATMMQLTDEDPDFWIEEKLDGERMQLHMRTVTKNEDGKEVTPFKEFGFWSRKAKNYTYLYGHRCDDKQAALTPHLDRAFDDNVESIILDGEMITWDPEVDKMVPFGTLKTAALEQQRNPYSSGPRPLYRVFDILHLNGTDLTRYDLRSRRSALERVIKPVDRRLELLNYSVGHSWDDVERALRKVVAEASEGLVLKNPRSRYRLNDRNDDWAKVKPEYMEEFGESLDCLVIGGYYGSGKRGGGLSSFLCGLRADNLSGKDASKKFLSFFKVGGGMTSNDYANINHHTEGKWVKWNSKNPPTDYIELGGGIQFQREKPDVWIKPEDSVVIQAKAASVGASDEFAANLTLRFPRFQKLRSDKDWTSALSLQEFLEVRNSAETLREENKQKAENEARMKAESNKKQKRVHNWKRPLQVVGYSQKLINQAAAQTEGNAQTNVFKGLTIFVITGAVTPESKTKPELEDLIQLHGGCIIQTADPKPKEVGAPADTVICIASKHTVKVRSLLKIGKTPILTPVWLFDCIEQARIDSAFGLTATPLRPEWDRHVYFSPEDRKEIYEMEVDKYGDSFARDITVEELRDRMDNMTNISSDMDVDVDDRLLDLVGETPGWLFKNTVIFFAYRDPDSGATDNGIVRRPAESGLSKLREAENIARFGSATIVENLDDIRLTHVVVDGTIKNDPEVRKLRNKIANKKRLPRVVTTEWIKESWEAKTRLDEERFAAI